MASDIRIGSRGQTVGPLKPAGRICINGETFDACSQRDWIGTSTNVVVIGTRSSNLVVRPFRKEDPPPESLGELLTIGDPSQDTPLQSPLALVERFNALVAGTVVGCVLIPIIWLGGTPLSLWALLVPVAGAATGFLFRWFVKGALESVGPREDHRPRAFEIAGIVTGSAAIGAFIGLSTGFGFLGLSCGLVLGALLGGFISWVQLLLSAT